MDKDRKLSDETLSKLRDAVSIVNLSGSTQLPQSELVDIVRGMNLDGHVTIDFRAQEKLGHPLVVFDSSSAGPNPALKSLLSPRELEISKLVAEGLANKEIAVRLGISLGTVKDHVHRILEKTGFSNRAAIAAAFPK
ncbi:MAG: response regulator transcription factor [Fimbriimonadaceae bacterium]|nr:response regulator transcription factor [Fimbriimonadaceae bacterium]